MRRLNLVLLTIGILTGGPGVAQSIEEARLTSAGAVLQTFMSNPETAIPAELLRQARGIAVIPGAVRVGFIFGGRRGRGLVTIRGNDGDWTNPSFITMTGGSVGAQIGIESTDIVLVFGSEDSVSNIGRGKFTLGGDAAVTAGPVGKATQATTDLTFTSEVYAYTNSRGLFAGASLEGTRIGIDVNANTSFYPLGSSAQPLQAQNFATPASVRRFLSTLTQAANNRGQPVPPGDNGTEGEEAIIYPLGSGSPVN
jgi:lipid-binding SYLF domain-containing protein